LDPLPVDQLRSHIREGDLLDWIPLAVPELPGYGSYTDYERLTLMQWLQWTEEHDTGATYVASDDGWTMLIAYLSYALSKHARGEF
jgi:hypothetical protein